MTSITIAPDSDIWEEILEVINDGLAQDEAGSTAHGGTYGAIVDAEGVWFAYEENAYGQRAMYCLGRDAYEAAAWLGNICDVNEGWL